MNPEDKALAIFTVAILLAITGGYTTGYHYARHRFQQPPSPSRNVMIIGTPNYTAVDTRDTNNIVFYVNTNCQPTAAK